MMNTHSSSLKIYGLLERNETKKLCSTYLEYVVKGLTLPSNMTDDEKAALMIIFKEIRTKFDIIFVPCWLGLEGISIIFDAIFLLSAEIKAIGQSGPI